MPDYEKLLLLLRDLVEDWKLNEGAYYNEQGDIFGSCARELENIIQSYEP